MKGAPCLYSLITKHLPLAVKWKPYSRILLCWIRNTMSTDSNLRKLIPQIILAARYILYLKNIFEIILAAHYILHLEKDPDTVFWPRMIFCILNRSENHFGCCSSHFMDHHGQDAQPCCLNSERKNIYTRRHFYSMLYHFLLTLSFLWVCHAHNYDLFSAPSQK